MCSGRDTMTKQGFFPHHYLCLSWVGRVLSVLPATGEQNLIHQPHCRWCHPLRPQPAHDPCQHPRRERGGKQRGWEKAETGDSTSCCCCTALPFLHTAEKGKGNDAIPEDSEGSWALKLKWTFRQLLPCLPQSKEVPWWGSSKPRCCIHFSFAKTFVLSGSSGSDCNSTWVWESKEFHFSEHWPLDLGQQWPCCQLMVWALLG